MVGGADQGVGGGQPLRGGGQFVEGVQLPGQVVEADGGPPGLRAAGVRADLEQAEVVVVGGVGGLEEGRAPEPVRGHRHRAEAQDVAVEGDAAAEVGDVEDGVVEAMDSHADDVTAILLSVQLFRL
ncbi:hypothetical protein AWV63_20930 [Micromonospora rifamycinica]|nr:hypothetical protein AWV63_20930 [Micromonospora rifamycinica]